MGKFRLLTADDIECRVKQVKGNGAVILLYKTARTDMDILDEEVGAENWESDFKEIKGNLYAGIGIRSGDRIVWKWDCGIESRSDGDGNEKKGEASDAFKRAGFKWGIGRELYTAPFIWIPASKMKIIDGKKTFDAFSVEKISYEDKNRISSLSIVNNKTGKTVYTWQGKKPEETAKPKEYKCIDCGEVITPYKGPNGKTTTIDTHVNGSLSKFGEILCLDCIEKRLAEKTDNNADK